MEKGGGGGGGGAAAAGSLIRNPVSTSNVDHRARAEEQQEGKDNRTRNPTHHVSACFQFCTSRTPTYNKNSVLPTSRTNTNQPLTGRTIPGPVL